MKARLQNTGDETMSRSLENVELGKSKHIARFARSGGYSIKVGSAAADVEIPKVAKGR
jgi:hypothetical protein